MAIGEVLIFLLGGVCAGILNSLAGFGSIITLAIYMDMMGLPGNIANATNRVNIIASSAISTLTFYKNGKLDLVKGKWHILVVIIGAIIGILLATDLNDEQFKTLFNYLLIPILLIILINPNKFISPDYSVPALSNWIVMPILFVFGLYAGLIQVGFGVIFLMVVVMLAKYDLIKANALKVTIVTGYSVIAILIFHLSGLIDWKYGLILSLGQGTGGYLAAKYASNIENANKYAYYFLLTIVVLVIIKNFELWKWFL